MGHIHLPQLPKTRPWREVVALLNGGASDDAVIAGAAIAAGKETLWRHGEITYKHAAAFGHVAFKKIGEEMRRKRDG